MCSLWSPPARHPGCRLGAGRPARHRVTLNEANALLGAADKGKGPLEGPFSTFVESVSLSSTSSRRPSVGSSWSLLFEASS